MGVAYQCRNDFQSPLEKLGNILFMFLALIELLSRLKLCTMFTTKYIYIYTAPKVFVEDIEDDDNDDDDDEDEYDDDSDDDDCYDEVEDELRRRGAWSQCHCRWMTRNLSTRIYALTLGGKHTSRKFRVVGTSCLTYGTIHANPETTHCCPILTNFTF